METGWSLAYGSDVARVAMPPTWRDGRGKAEGAVRPATRRARLGDGDATVRRRMTTENAVGVRLSRRAAQ